MSALNEKQAVALEVFRNKVGDAITEEERLSDAFLQRWLVARDYDVSKAETMLRNHVQWRKDMDVAGVLTWEAPEVLRLYYTAGITGYDKENCPVVVVPFGLMDVRGVLEAAGKENFIRYTLQFLEQVCFRMKSKKTPDGKEVTRIVVVFDCEHFSFKVLSHVGVVDCVLDLIRQYEANYPETLKAAIVINAPRFFAILFGMIKPLLSAHTMSKIQIHGYEPNKWMKALLDEIPVSQLPRHWGGSMKGTDEFCSAVVCMGGPVPGKYFSNGQATTDNGEDRISFTVGAGSKFDMEYDIAVVNSVLKWTFSTDGYDIGFSVKFENQEIVPYRRIDSHKTKEEGSVTCEKIGKYTITFDNTYSRLRSKTLHYLVTILSEDGIVIEDEDVATSL